MKLKQNKFQNCFVSVSFRCVDSLSERDEHPAYCPMDTHTFKLYKVHPNISLVYDLSVGKDITIYLHCHCCSSSHSHRTIKNLTNFIERNLIFTDCSVRRCPKFVEVEYMTDDCNEDRSIKSLLASMEKLLCHVTIFHLFPCNDYCELFPDWARNNNI